MFKFAKKRLLATRITETLSVKGFPSVWRIALYNTNLTPFAQDMDFISMSNCYLCTKFDIYRTTNDTTQLSLCDGFHRE